MAREKLQKTARAGADTGSDNLAKLRAVFPQFVRDGVVDFDGLKTFFDAEGMTVGGEIADKTEIFRVLTVVANESYQEYVAALQREFQEAGYDNAPDAEDAREKRITVRAVRKIMGTEDFRRLLERISARTRYAMELKTDVLVEKAATLLGALDMSGLIVAVDKVAPKHCGPGQVGIRRGGV